jgi:CCR4-NOT transcriptional regulation complex NOT5 subunit
MIRLDGEYKEEMMLNVFKKDEEFLKNEKQYEDIKCEILGESDASDSDSSGMGLSVLCRGQNRSG